ncbi:hypothetical protein [Candidatus Kryptobacter tengchongensis]|uniref:Lipoprotein n=1 Tax=Kryptobacter tengchongensis TaxID=1643429 RepID=A0A656D609_KRYT1|nr:hypothetical protein [Candidatus Kryptobacter tengchongensis]CUS98341.1 hypothetical protein JGI24_00435 [Candidatus Kryptobacter tengchongensis]
MLKKLPLIILLIISSCSKKPQMIPQSLGELKLDKFLVGKEAREFINQMHVSGMVAGDRNEVGFYSLDTLKAVLYISKFKSSEIAEQKLEQMLIKIAHGGTPFVLHNQFRIQNRDIFLVFGMGQSHYIYADKDKLIWLSADMPISLVVLHSFLKQKM